MTFRGNGDLLEIVTSSLPSVAEVDFMSIYLHQTETVGIAKAEVYRDSLELDCRYVVDLPFVVFERFEIASRIHVQPGSSIAISKVKIRITLVRDLRKDWGKDMRTTELSSSKIDGMRGQGALSGG